MTNQIIFPAEYGRERGRITSSVQDSPSTYTIYARRRNGDYMDITGAAIDAKFELISTGTVYDSTGTFTIVNGSGGCFTWLPSSADLGLAGDFYLQFTIDGERSEDDLAWEVQARLDSDGSTPPTAMTSLTAAQAALVVAIQGLTGLVEMAAGSATGVAIQTFMRTFLGSANEVAALTNIGAAAASDLTAHTAVTTTVHGIADTSVLITTTHSNLTTTAHGGILPENASIVAVSGGRDLASTDAGKILECTGTFTLTCPNGLDTGFQCAVVNISTGVITLAATTTLTTKDSAVTLANQYGGATVYHAGSNVWRAIGDLS